jgi:hypothetical protein
MIVPTAKKNVVYAILTGLMLVCFPAYGINPFPKDCWGVYSWASWNTQKVSRERCPLIKGAPIILKWNTLEPEPGTFAFERQLDKKLRLAVDNDFYVFVMIWVAPNAPHWLYENGVPEVHMTKTISPQRKPRNWTFQYYLDDDYIRYFHRLIRRFGQHLRDLPPVLQERILYVQSAEGSTGDGFCYKGAPLDARYTISRDQWSQFRMDTWRVFKEAFTGDRHSMVKPLLVNYDSNRAAEYNWVMTNLNAIGLKNGMFSHGYHISDTQQRLANWRRFTSKVHAADKTFFSRGEQDAEWQICGWSKQNPQQALYWSALFATHCGLDMWNLPSEACQGQDYAPTITFFNRYAGQHDAATSPSAFCALRQGLDAADTSAYPEAIYGKAKKANTERYQKIARTFSTYGAIQGDPDKATGGGMKNRQRDHYNDVGWGILPGNYCRFLEQINPDATSIGWWHRGPEDSIYSRFGRSFDHNQGKTKMAFRLNEDFFEDKPPHPIHLRIVYLDQGDGTWALDYQGSQGRTQVEKITCRNTNTWQEREIFLKNAHFNNALPGQGDLILYYLDGSDTVFHMIEVNRIKTN